MSKRWTSVMVSAALAAAVVFSSTGTTDAHHAVVRVNLEEMTVASERIFQGHCVAVEETREMIAQGYLPVTRYTFEVERVVKGKTTKQIVITQVGHAPRRILSKRGGLTMHGRAITQGSLLHGAAAYRVGDEVVLFLNPVSPSGKITSPVGLYQGAFFVSQMPSGQKLVRNSLNNLGLFTTRYTGAKLKESDAKVIFPDRDNPLEGVSGIDVQSLSRKRGGLSLEDFLSVVEQINLAHGGERGSIVHSGKGVLLK